jgi:hypothetical protein
MFENMGLPQKPDGFRILDEGGKKVFASIESETRGCFERVVRQARTATAHRFSIPRLLPRLRQQHARNDPSAEQHYPSAASVGTAPNWGKATP